MRSGQQVANVVMTGVAGVEDQARECAGPEQVPIVEGEIADRIVPFDAMRHIDFAPPQRVITMAEIGLSAEAGVSPVAVSLPFKLFNEEAIQQMRAEILQPEVLKNCSFSSNLAPMQLRGYAAKYAPFTYAAWKSPEILSIISSIAGIDLVPVNDYEIAHINFAVKSEQQTAEEIALIKRQQQLHASDEGIEDCFLEEKKPVVGWHKDSYPFVCVLMMSDCTDMVGGETALLTGSGEVLKVRGPQMGCAVVLQGGYITHEALRALGAKERITSVMSLRPRDALIKDDSRLNTVRGNSNLSELYDQFAEYHLDILEARIRRERERMRERRQAGQKFDVTGHKKFLEAQIQYMEHTSHEIVEYDRVVPGEMPELGIPDAVVDGEGGRCPSASLA